ncbi:hypothetical protein GCM10023085_59350 [Actinomadura viridis]|uniref:Uncharacterized protein n=1 Tax=Actinomadura viridis TaxID=58110 RepID=A0A931DSW1_9ACTN|nr:hypothetical protein [Actinomadura viridis]MBG6093271.1 hypothetical protein [Actinomadura viridis]
MSNLPPRPEGDGRSPAGGPPPTPPGAPERPEGYDGRTRLPVVRLPVMSGDRHLGYLWASVDDRAAGFLRRKEFREAFEPLLVWGERLQEAYEEGLGAREAIRRWAGRPEDAVAGGVPADAAERVEAGLEDLYRLADPDYEPSPLDSLGRGEFPDGTPMDRSKGWGPLHFELPPSYDLDTDGPVRYFPVVKGDVVLGYLWAAVEGEAAMYRAREDAGMDGANAASRWILSLRELYEEGVPALEALARCKAAPEDPRGGVIPAGATAEELPSLRDLERLATTYEQSLRVSFSPELQDPDVHRRPPLSPDEREPVLRYLRDAPLVYDLRELFVDGFDPDRPARVPGTYQTDGTWMWTGGVAYHLEIHGIPPEPDLVEHIRANGFQVPEADAAARAKATRTLAWRGVLVPPPAAPPRPARGPGRLTEDIAFRQVGPAPDGYAARTGGPVRYLAVGDAAGTVLGYLWAAEGEEAAGFVPREAAGADALNESVAWTLELRDAKSRGVPAARLLAEFGRARLPVAARARHAGQVIGGSEARVPGLDALRELAAGR